MSEAIGEIRRHLLDIIRHGDLERGEELLQAMDDIYYVLVSMDYPDALTGGLPPTSPSRSVGGPSGGVGTEGVLAHDRSAERVAGASRTAGSGTRLPRVLRVLLPHVDNVR